MQQGWCRREVPLKDAALAYIEAGELPLGDRHLLDEQVPGTVLWIADRSAEQPPNLFIV